MTVLAGARVRQDHGAGTAIRSNHAARRGVDVWVSCEPGDGDAEPLAEAIATALGRPDRHLAPAERVIEALALMAPIDVCLVIDDVHEIGPGSASAALLGHLVTHLPPHAHVVLSGRRMPPIPTGERRPVASLTLGAAALAFNPSEISSLVALVDEPDPDLDALERLAGWPSLVRLALSAPPGSAPQFLWEEVIAGLDAEERHWLLALVTLGWGDLEDVAELADAEPAVAAAALAALAVKVPLLTFDRAGTFRVHALWEHAAERIFPEREQRPVRRRALALLLRRGEALRAGWRAHRWRDGPCCWRRAGCSSATRSARCRWTP